MRQTTNIIEALANFDSLPDSANVRLPVVMRLYGISSASVWRNVGKTIPKPRKLSPRTTCWNVGELRKALDTTEAKG